MPLNLLRDIVGLHPLPKGRSLISAGLGSGRRAEYREKRNRKAQHCFHWSAMNAPFRGHRFIVARSLPIDIVAAGRWSIDSMPSFYPRRRHLPARRRGRPAGWLARQRQPQGQFRGESRARRTPPPSPENIGAWSLADWSLGWTQAGRQLRPGRKPLSPRSGAGADIFGRCTLAALHNRLPVCRGGLGASIGRGVTCWHYPM